jgi:hypothetical protein
MYNMVLGAHLASIVLEKTKIVKDEIWTYF